MENDLAGNGINTLVLRVDYNYEYTSYQNLRDEQALSREQVKMLATPSWTAICAGISTASFTILHILADRLKLSRWADIIAPAGNSTLTCYLMPYYAYALIALAGIQLPGMLLAGVAGLIKSLLFSLLIILLTGWLGRLNVALKI